MDKENTRGSDETAPELKRARGDATTDPERSDSERGGNQHGGPEKTPVAIGVLPVLPLRNSVLFPSMMMPLAASREASVAAIEAAMASEDKTLIVATQLDPAVEEPQQADLFEYATIGVIKKAERSNEGISLIAQGIERVRILKVEMRDGYLQAHFEVVPVCCEKTEAVEALRRNVVELATKIAEHLKGNAPAAVGQILAQVTEPLELAYLLASLMGLSIERDRALLAANTCEEVLKLLVEYLSYELKVRELQMEIASTAQSEMNREQREYLLRRQLEAIRRELGEEGAEQADLEELRQRFEETQLPEEVAAEVEKELQRLERMSPNAAEYQLTRTYVDLLLELPWDKTTDDNLDLHHARAVLDEDHFDLDSIKDRIIEHLAVMKLNPNAKAPILCFVGPPGVGKTSLGKSIAKALGRKFERLALGGLHDEAELRGHRRTYIGAMPGRIIQAIRRAGTKNPVIMLDEIDKLGRDYRGDPAAALMEILDPEQNREFHDNYLDLPFDLSKVFFITTANTLDTIPAPLLDRMEVLQLSGYSSEEKEKIARRYLIPRQLAEAGVSPEQLVISDEALRYVIRGYTREAGVRNLERMLGRIVRKVARRIVEGETGPITITPDDLTDILGPERFTPEKARQHLRPGVAAGLAWTPTGGDVLYVEAVEVGRGGKLTLTGHLGKVMKESARAALSYLISMAPQLGLEKEHLMRASVHIHVPAGAVPKDGPSAGVTMATALASLFAHAPARADTAMTGEITLSGLVLPVGGIKEKVLAAHRAGIRRVILPQANEKDLTELPEEVRQDMEFLFAERIEDALAAAIPEMADRKPPISLV
ncbi:MAG: Lon protease [Pirellulaceae bacterium]|nr:MAG: Lon protease [Pirellulaceae bacterium]